MIESKKLKETTLKEQTKEMPRTIINYVKRNYNTREERVIEFQKCFRRVYQINKIW